MERINERVVRGPEEPKDKTVTWIYTENGGDEVKKKYIDGEWTEVATDKEKELQEELDEALDKLSIRYYIDGASNPDIDFCISKNSKRLKFTKDICDIYYPFEDDLLGETDFNIMIFSAQSDGIVCYCTRRMYLETLFDDNIAEDSVDDYFSYSAVDDNINSVSSAINYFVINNGLPILYIETSANISSQDSITEMLETLKNETFLISYLGVEL